MKSVQKLEANIKRHKQAVLVVNTHSRRGRLLYGEVKKLLQANGYTLTKAYALKDPRNLRATIQKIMTTKPELLLVGSGDGTISAVVDYLAYTDTVLGYLPLGTTNNFGRSLGLPLKLEEAVANILHGKVAEIDLGKVNEDYFGNLASFGISVRVASSTPRGLKRRVGRLAYALVSIKSTLSHKPFQIKLLGEGIDKTYNTHQFLVANGSVHSGKAIAADAAINNRVLAAYALGGRTRISAFLNIVRHFRTTGKLMRHKDILTSRTFTVTTSPAQAIDIDGEVVAAPDNGVYHFEVAEKALKVFVPQNFEG